jgi:hypothetical protein
VREKFILWAQALDNASPDHFDFRGEELSADDSRRREEAVSLVSSVIKKGRRVYPDKVSDPDKVSGVVLTADDGHFVLEVPSAQRDRAGRIAPIVCYGDYNAAGGDALGDSAADALYKFATRIGRTLQPEHLERARASFKALKKKSPTTKILRTVGIGAAALVLLALLHWLAQRRR